MQNPELLQATDHIHLNLLSYWMFGQNYQVLIYINGSFSKTLQCLKLLTIQFSRSVVSDSLRPHEPQHARPPCPSPTPGACSDSSPSSQWCHPTISSSVVPFSSCPQFLPASGSFPVSQLFTSGGWSIGSFSFSISPSNEHPGLISFRMDWFDLLAVQGTPQESSPAPQIKNISSSVLSFLHSPTVTSIHDHWKNHSLD